VPANDIAKQVENRLTEVGRTVRLPGFRPGKAPAALLKQRYGESVQGEVLEAMISRTSRELMSERNLRPALQPKVEVTAFGEGKDLSYAISFEILPEVTPVDFKTIAIERLAVPVEESEVGKAIEDLAKMRRPTKLVEGKRAAKTGDTLKIDFDGTVDGTPRPGMKAEGFMLELGSKSFIDTFEDQLTGSKAGDSKVVTVTFPEEYHAEELAGKVAEFKVTVHELHEPGEVAIDDAFAKGFGMESLDKLKEQIRTNIGDSYKHAARLQAKRALLDKLADAHSFEVPEGMVEYEFNNIWQQREQQGPDPEEKGTTDEEIRKEYRDIAERRVRLGLLLAEVGRKNKIEVSQEDLRRAVISRAREYPGQEKQVFEFFMKNQEALNSLHAPLFEDKVVDFILELAKVTEKPGTLADLKGETGEDGEGEKPKAGKKKAGKKA
jgi:trigger factor